MKLWQILVEQLPGANKGVSYEKVVSAALRDSGLARYQKRSASFNPYLPDLNFVVNGRKYGLEVKLDAYAQMGGSSVKYDPDAGSIKKALQLANFDPLSDDDSMSDLVLMAVETKLLQINDLLSFLIHYPSNTGVNQYIRGFPLVASRNAWQAAKRKGLLLPINKTITYDSSYIINHYRKKNVHYIQIGGLGAFYLAENPANLPIPQLSGTANIEIRAGAGGSRTMRGSKEQIISATIRVPGRLAFKGKSPYSFDNVKSIETMIGNIQ